MTPSRRALLAGLVALPAPALSQPGQRAGLTVGPGGAFPGIAAAVAAAQDGDTLLVQAGTYTDDFAIIGKRLTIRAVSGMARLVATVTPPNGKALLVIGADCIVEGLDFSGVLNPSLNGAGIRYEGGRQEIRRCRFQGNQMNMLAANAPEGSIAIAESEFGPTVPSVSLSHSLYVNGVGSLVVRDSLFHGAATGHQIKSRALRTTITGCRIFDGAGRGAYNVDLPNGGVAVIERCVLEQGPETQNPAILHFGGEGEPYPVSSLRVAGNTVLNRLPLRSARLLRNQTETRALVADNRVFGLEWDQINEGPAEVSGMRMLAAAPVLDMSPPWRR